MKKHMKNMPIIVMLAGALALGLIGCDNGGDTHTHSYSTTWSKNAAQHWRECDCGDKTEVANHTAGDWIVDQAATATTAGSKHKECTVCGYETETETIPATGEGHVHSYSATWSKNATQHWHECSCGEKADVANHTAGDWIADQAATVTTPGSKHKECTVCGYITETGTIPVIEEGHVHSYSSTWSKNATQHWKECSCGDKTEVANHTGDPCTVCGYSNITLNEGEIGVTVNFTAIADETINLGDVNTLSTGGNITVTVTGSYTSYEWYIDGEKATGTTSQIVINGSSLKPGPHTVTAIVKKGTTPYSKVLKFTK